MCGAEVDSSGRRGALHRSGATWHCNACGERMSDAALVHHALGLTWKQAYRWLEGEAVGEPLEGAREPEALERPDVDVLRRELRRAAPVPAAALDELGLPRAAGRAAGWLPRTSLLRPGYPLVVPAFTGVGELASLQGRSVPTRSPKTSCPTGYDFRGLLFLDASLARPFVRGGPAPERLFVAEGLTDYLTACALLPGWGVIGVVSGSASALHLLAPRIQEHRVHVAVGTDGGPQGHKYALQVADALAPHPVYRFDPSAQRRFAAA